MTRKEIEEKLNDNRQCRKKLMEMYYMLSMEEKMLLCELKLKKYEDEEK